MDIAIGAARQQAKHAAAQLRLPLTQPNAPKLSAYAAELRAIEASCWLSNYGPVNTRLEDQLLQTLFEDRGSCLTVCNATIGLILALKHAAESVRPAGRYVIMPSFTFAAAAHAVWWAGLRPLLVDIDPETWTADPHQERLLLDLHGSAIAAVMPYAAFGAGLDLHHYDRLADRYGVPVVVDAAASLGSLDETGAHFGQGSNHAFVYSMHATKAFGVGEAGLIYSAEPKTIETLRRMGNFGFGAERSATMAGLNSKISEVVALSALIKLSDFDAQISHRAALADVYHQELAGFTFQRTWGRRTAYQFMPVLLPRTLQAGRKRISALLAEREIGTGHYFSPHIYDQPYFRTRCEAADLAVTDDVAARMLSLPISDFLTTDDVAHIAASFRDVCRQCEADLPPSLHSVAA